MKMNFAYLASLSLTLVLGVSGCEMEPATTTTTTTTPPSTSGTTADVEVNNNDANRPADDRMDRRQNLRERVEDVDVSVGGGKVDVDVDGND